MNSHGGFTLVELIVVISVMGIMAAFTIPRFVSNDIFQTRGDADALASSLRYAQKTAIAQRTNVYAVYNTGLISLCFTTDCGSTVIDPGTGAAYVFQFSNSVNVSASNSSLGFNSLGQPIPNTLTTYTVTNKNNSAQSLTVTVEANTGYVH